MSFIKDNRAYEAWLHDQCSVVEEDIVTKHRRMRKSAFIFLRATYFRWAKVIEALCPDLAKAPPVLAVGDTHIENFGIWRDAEGRLIWGLNDFDEAAVMPYPFDLVRLAVSARLADRGTEMQSIADYILAGYRQGLRHARPTLLDQQETWMRRYVACTDKERRLFWREVKNYPDAKPPQRLQIALRRSLPEEAELQRFASRIKGGGSLGRQRFVAIADWRGGLVLREAKALVPSAWDWAHDMVDQKSQFLTLARGKYRANDPFLDVRDRFVIRRIAPDSRKVTLEDGRPFSPELLTAMGFDLGAIHAADAGAAAVSEDFDNRPQKWLRKAAKTALRQVEADYATWVERTEGA